MTDGRREQILAAAEDLTRGMQDNDADVLGAVYSSDAIVWHNTDRRDASISELLDVVRVLRQRGSCSMRVDERFVIDVGFLQTHTATYRFNSGASTEVQAALLAWVDDEGRITRVKEYLDSEALAPLIAAVTAEAEQSAEPLTPGV
jgi:hypothetical protein